LLPRLCFISIPSGAIKRKYANNINWKSYKISIPSGAIKSGGCTSFIFSYLGISIPSGAIKSYQGDILSGWVLQFQFLLVRLRAPPSGVTSWFLIFQFLLVRLRAPVVTDAIKTAFKFQFLLVRLRVFSESKVLGNTYISIPSGAIKSRYFRYKV